MHHKTRFWPYIYLDSNWILVYQYSVFFFIESLKKTFEISLDLESFLIKNFNLFVSF